MKKAFIATTLILAGCASSVTQTNDNSLDVQSNFATVDPISADGAHKICAKRGGYAKHVSTAEIQTPNYLPNKYLHSFRCVSGSRKPVSNGYLNSSRTL